VSKTLLHFSKIEGHEVKRLMRQHKIRIRDVALKHQITLKRVRQVRAEGVQGFLAAEWLFIITGQWPGEGVGG